MKKKFCLGILIFSLVFSGCGPAKVVQTLLQESETVMESEEKESTVEETVTEEIAEEMTEESVTEENPVETDEVVVEQTDESPEKAYVAEDGTIVRLSSERLAELEDAVMQVIMALPTEIPESTLTQADLDEATVQWFNTTYAVMLYQNNFDYTLIGGSEPGPGTNTYLLERDWGITDRASAIENIKWLISEGHRVTYEQIEKDLIEGELFDCTFEEYMSIIELSAQMNEMDLETVGPIFERMYHTYQECGEAGVKAWDYCRVMQMCGNYYVAGYLTLEEAMDVSLAMAQLMQAEYVSWEDMMNSFLYGYYFWRGEGPEEEDTGSYWRRYYYDELRNKEGNPYSVNHWDTEFVVNWR